MKRATFFCFLMAFCCAVLYASPLDDLVGQFGLSDTTVDDHEEARSSLVVDLPSSDGLSVESILHPDPLSVSGRLDGSVDVDGSGILTPKIRAELSADIRPDSWFRFFIGTQADLPSRFDDTNPLDFSVTELFADFSFTPSMFLRLGRQKGDWGEGLFWNVGDLLNIDGKNYQTAPLAVRYSVSFGGSHHADVWALMPATVEAARRKDWGVAASYDFSVSAFALRIGGTYRYQGVSGGTLSMSTAFGPVAVSAIGSVSYGFPGRPLETYPNAYYAASVDCSWRSKPRGIVFLSGQFLAESFPRENPDGKKLLDMEHGQFLVLSVQLRSPWEKVPVSLLGRGMARLDKFCGSWQASIGWDPLDYLTCFFFVRGGWGDRSDDPWELCSIPGKSILWGLSLSITKSF